MSFEPAQSHASSTLAADRTLVQTNPVAKPFRVWPDCPSMIGSAPRDSATFQAHESRSGYSECSPVSDDDPRKAMVGVVSGASRCRYTSRGVYWDHSLATDIDATPSGLVPLYDPPMPR